MTKLLRLLAITFLLGLIMPSAGQAADIGQILSTLKQGGHVIVFRHVETDESQKDVYPFKFDDMSAQRQIASMAVSDRACTPCVSLSE